MSISASVLRLGRWTNRSAATIDREIDEEFDFHVECRTQELIQSGMSPEQAAVEATAQFGARGRIRQECQVIGYGHNVWLMLTLVSGILLCLGAIGWMAWLLKTANQKNQHMQALVASLQPVPDEKSDLTGEIKDAAGKPVVGARVLLVFKSWPGGRYQQEGLVQTTDDSGKFRFPELYSVAMQNAFLITVLAEGHAMQSDYVLYKPKEKVKPFRFKLQPALEKTLVVHNKDGAPIGNAVVFPSTRTPAKVKADDGFLMYDQSAEAAGYKTDADGKVRMNIFSAGDSVQLGVVDGEPINFVVDEAAEQKIGKGMTSGAASVGGIEGKVMDASGQPVAEAKVLLILKTWPKGRFQQQPSETITDADGSFAFPVGNQLDDKEAFLVTVVKEGFAFQSRYIIKKPGEPAESPEFKLSAATKKTFALRSASGKPMANVVVSLSGRKQDKSDEQMIYGISYPSVSFKTDADGKVALNFFATGDTAKLSVESSGGAEEVEFKVDDKPEQTVDVKKKVK